MLLHYNLHKVGKLGVLLPGALLAVMPITDGIRQPDRFGVVVLLCVAALAALGFDAVAARVRSRARWTAGALFVGADRRRALRVRLSQHLLEHGARGPSKRGSRSSAAAALSSGCRIPGSVEDEEIYKTTVTGKPIAFGASTFPPPQIVALKTWPDELSERRSRSRRSTRSACVGSSGRRASRRRRSCPGRTSASRASPTSTCSSGSARRMAVAARGCAQRHAVARGADAGGALIY